MTVERLVNQYRRGVITADHLFVQFLHMIDPAAPGLVLAAVPGDLRPRLTAFVNDFRIGRMVSSHGLPPANDQVLAARRWLTGPTASRTSNAVADFVPGRGPG